MTRSFFPFTSLLSLHFYVAVTILAVISSARALGSGSTLAVISATATVCGIVGRQPTQSIACYSLGQPVPIPVQPNISFSAISGGDTIFCGLRSGGYALLCWETQNSTFTPKRLYFNSTSTLRTITVGSNQICAVQNGTWTVSCWRGASGNDTSSQAPSSGDRFNSVSCGVGFCCGVLTDGNRVRCWSSGSNASSLAAEIQNGFGNVSLASVQAGGAHACGLTLTRTVECRGSNGSGQLEVPANQPDSYAQLALGEDYTCAIRTVNKTVVCWGGRGEYSVNATEGMSFETIVSGSNLACGLVSSNLSVMCWGPGWPNQSNLLPFQSSILPGPCVMQLSSCNCSVYLGSQFLCGGAGYICQPCDQDSPPSSPPPLSTPSPTSPTPSTDKQLAAGLLAFAIVGSLGCLAGICAVAYCLWTGVCFGNKKIHNSVQPQITRNGSDGGAASTNGVFSRSSTLIRRQSSRIMRRQRSGTSSKPADRAEEFTLAELAAATNDFSLDTKIGAGSFGVVYRGKLGDGREVAIKRGETGQKTKKFQEKESAFESELAFLSRLHHKHLVGLVGYCEDGDERLLVYEYMKNGALYDHLHDKNNLQKSSSVINSWKIRIKIALDAARGIEYLHNYAVPPIIHRDIKSSNILLDANWTARVSDFGLSLMGSESKHDHRPMKAVGTVGYIDPEYYGLNVLTAKSDVYGLGVVLLELLTGKRAIFKDDDNGGTPTSIVDFAVPRIMVNELVKVLDPRVCLPELNEAEAVELVAYTAMHCVNLEGKDRPTMTDIVANLERALSLCDGSHGSISSGTISIVSD